MILAALSGGPASAAALTGLVAGGKRVKSCHVRRPGRDRDAAAARATAGAAGVEHEEIFLDLSDADIPDAVTAAIALPHAVCQCRDCRVHAVIVGRLDPWAREVFLALMGGPFVFAAPPQPVERAA